MALCCNFNQGKGERLPGKPRGRPAGKTARGEQAGKRHRGCVDGRATRTGGAGEANTTERTDVVLDQVTDKNETCLAQAPTT